MHKLLLLMLLGIALPFSLAGCGVPEIEHQKIAAQLAQAGEEKAALSERLEAVDRERAELAQRVSLLEEENRELRARSGSRSSPPALRGETGRR